MKPMEFRTVPMMELERKKSKIIEQKKCVSMTPMARNSKEFEKLKAEIKDNSVSRVIDRIKEMKFNDFFISDTGREFKRRRFSTKPENHTLLQRTNRNSFGSPEWFHVLDKPQNQISPAKSPAFDGTLTILSKAQGWITVTPAQKSRRKPLEKLKEVLNKYL
jgi:hypothetical protein